MKRVHSLWGAFGIGIVAGLAIAMPLGAIAVLLLREGMVYGFKVAAAGAAGVAVIDGLYASFAVAAGTVVRHLLAGHERFVHIAGAVVLAAVALHGIWTTRRRPVAVEPVEASPTKTFVRFLGLTAVNPATALYFAVVVAGFGGSFHGVGPAGLFVAGVFLASITWQMLLAALGTVSGSRLSPSWRLVTSYVGYGIVLVLALALALSA